MEIQVIQGNILESQADTLVCNLFEGETTLQGASGALDRALNGAISDLIALGDLSGKSGKVAVIYPRGTLPASRVIVVGVGKRAELCAKRRQLR
jgi:leucyl aminopeptidase